MGKKIQKIKDFISKSKPSLISGGNSFDIHTMLDNQTNIDLASLGTNTTSALTSAVSVALSKINETKLAQKIFNPYILLNYQANYYCGTCEFETENVFIKRLMMLVIRGAFLYGTAGIFVDKENNIRAVYITSMEYGIDGKLKKAKIYSLDLLITNMNKNQAQITNEQMTLQDLNEQDCERLAIFQWGVMGFSAWITIWPFVNLQMGLLKMIIAQSYIYLKKIGYNVENTSAVLDDLELFFNEDNPFIIKTNMSKDIANRFSVDNVQADFSGNDFIEYYEKTIYAFYHIMGRRINNDVKKERNVSNEVDASQENYDVLQEDWLKYFDIFVDKLNELVPDANVKGRIQIKQEQEAMQMQMENDNGNDK